MKQKVLYNFLINWGVTLLAVSITFSITLMNISFALLALAALLRITMPDIKYSRTGIEIPVLVFLGVYMISAITGANPLKSTGYIIDNYWYILHLFIIVFLFNEKETYTFVKTLSWAAVVLAFYTILQSLVGLNFNLNFQIGNTIKMATPKLHMIYSLGDYPIYLGSGITGQYNTFCGQILMLLFIVYGYFGKKWQTLVVFLSLLLTFMSSLVISTFAAILSVYMLRAKKPGYRYIALLALALLLYFHLFSAGDNSIASGYKAPGFKELIIGKGASVNGNTLSPAYRKPSPSIYVDLLKDGGLVTLLAVLFLFYRMFALYIKMPLNAKGRWKQLHTGCLLALAALLFAGLSRNYLIDAENSVLFWTIAGLMIRLKTSRWSKPLYIYEDYEDLDIYV